MGSKTYEQVYRTTIKVTEDVGEDILVDYSGAIPAAGEAVLGPAYTKADEGDNVAVTVIGKVSCIASGAIAAGAALAATAEGKVATHADGQAQIGRAMEAAAADGDEITCLVFPS